MKFLRFIFTWWHGQTFGTALFTLRRGKLVGTDGQGNKYYVDKKGRSINGKPRRWVIFNGDVEASRVPPEWHGWLHYTVDETPLDSLPIRKDWHQPHQINQTGLDTAYQPDGSLLDTQKTQKVGNGDYEAWSPK